VCRRQAKKSTFCNATPAVTPLFSTWNVAHDDSGLGLMHEAISVKVAQQLIPLFYFLTIALLSRHHHHHSLGILPSPRGLVAVLSSHHPPPLSPVQSHLPI
jgi:hypothetical protein